MGTGPFGHQQSISVDDAGQSTCYGLVAPIACPPAGEAYHGQDSQYDGFQPSYQVSNDGLTVTDLVTGLVWQRVADTLNAAMFAGHTDSRLPCIKELQSIVDDTRSPDTSGSAAIARSSTAPSSPTSAARTTMATTGAAPPTPAQRPERRRPCRLPGGTRASG